MGSLVSAAGKCGVIAGGTRFEVIAVTLAVPSIVAGQLVDALTQVRMSRHHRACRCGLFRGLRNEPFCSADEQKYSYLVDRLLDAVMRSK